MELNKFNDTLLYSNKNVEKLAKKLVNTSANAVMMEMFEDKCILADHTTGQIFEAKYSFDGSTFVFEEFNEIELEHNNSELKEAIGSFFDDETINLAEAYEKVSNTGSDIFESSLTEALASKNMDSIVNYAELSGINEELEELKGTNLFKVFSERLNTNPTEDIKVFNWKDPVKVSVLDEDVEKVVNKSLVSKSKTLKSNIEFKKMLAEAAKEAMKGDVSAIEDLIHENISMVALDKADLKALVGLSVIGDKELMENRTKIVNIINETIENNNELSSKKALLEEEETEDDNDTAPEASEKDLEVLKKALETAKEKVEDEKLISKIEDLIDAIDEASKSGETDVGAVKESIQILSL